MFPNLVNNVRSAIDNAAEGVSQHFEQNRRRSQSRRRNRSQEELPSQPRTPQASRSVPQEQQPPPPSPPPPPPPSGRAPPASQKAIRKLPTIAVAPEDLVDENNRECCICFEENKLDDKVTRLPCAHIFHSCCIIDWLSNHSCTCPVCRYELATDYPLYEAGRIQRMAMRKPRYAMHELNRMAIPALLALYRGPVSGAVEKKDLIQSLIDEERIDIIPTPEPVEYKIEELQSMKVGELKRTMEDAGVFFRREDVVEKIDMISIFENSGRLVLLQSEEDTIIPPPHGSIRSVVDDNNETTTNSRLPSSSSSSSSSNEDVRSSPSESSFTSNIERGPDTNNKRHKVIVETVIDDYCEIEGDKATIGSPIVMFPEAELIEENVHHQTRSASQIQPVTTEDDNAAAAEITSIRSDTEILEPNITLSQQQSGSQNITTPIDSTRGGSDEQSETQYSVAPMDIEEQNLSSTIESFDQGTDLRGTFQHYTINHLQILAQDLQIDLSFCIEREEMIDILVNAGVTGSPDPCALSPLMFSSWSISQLRVVASEANIDLSQCKTGNEMVEKILYAGNHERLYLRDYLRSLSPLTTKSIPDLRAISRELQIDISDCLEKDEIIQRVITRGRRLGVC